MILIIKGKSMFYECFFLTNPYLFLTNPDYKIVFLDLFRIYMSVYQLVVFLSLCFIYSHLLLSFLLINLDNVRRCFFYFHYL